MNRAPLHGAPVRGQAPPARAPARGNQPAFGTQDARSNLAVQPAANAGGGLKLKKAAVKIVGAAAPAPPPSTPFRVTAPTSTTSPATGSSPVPGPVKAKAKEPERYVIPTPAVRTVRRDACRFALSHVAEEVQNKHLSLDLQCE